MYLTAHSMEEAEALCDRVCIFVDGVCSSRPDERRPWRHAAPAVLCWETQGRGGGGESMAAHSSTSTSRRDRGAAATVWQPYPHGGGDFMAATLGGHD